MIKSMDLNLDHLIFMIESMDPNLDHLIFMVESMDLNSDHLNLIYSMCFDFLFVSFLKM